MNTGGNNAQITKDSGFSSFNSNSTARSNNAAEQQLTPLVPKSPCGSPNSTFGSDRSRGGGEGPMVIILIFISSKSCGNSFFFEYFTTQLNIFYFEFKLPVNAAQNETISIWNDSGNSTMGSIVSQYGTPYANRVFDIERLKNWVEQTVDTRCPGTCERDAAGGGCDCEECSLKNMMGLLTHWRALYTKKS